jgi:hypothetical protein
VPFLRLARKLREVIDMESIVLQILGKAWSISSLRNFGMPGRKGCIEIANDRDHILLNL